MVVDEWRLTWEMRVFVNPTDQSPDYHIGMNVRLVDRRGRPITIRDVMLHHVVFHRRARLASRGPCSSRGGEPIYGTGEERQALRFPRGYGYRIRRGDRWRVTAMLMSHSAVMRSDVGFVGGGVGRPTVRRKRSRR